MKRVLLALPLILLCSAPSAHATHGGAHELPGVCAVRNLSYGAGPTTGSISVAGGIGCYRFSGAAGDAVRVRLIPTSGTLDPVVGVARPDGASRCAASAADEFTCRLDADGAHRMTVADLAGTATGSYALSIQRLNDPVGCATLSFGAAATAGSIATTGETDCYRLTGEAGDRLRVRQIATGGALDPSAEVVAPDGSRLCAPSTADDLTCRLTDGTHTILVGDAAPGTATGEYQIAIRRLNSSVGCSQLPLAVATARTIATVAETDCWSVRGDVADRLRLRLVRTSGALNPVAEVVQPDGTTRCAATLADELTCVLATSGTHTILVRDQGGTSSGDYAIAVQRLNNPVGCRTLSFGTLPTSASIGAAGEADCYRFDAAGGDRVRVGAIAFGGAAAVAEVLRPDGTTRCGPTRLRFTCAVDQTGRHTILVVSETLVAASSYGILVQRLNAPVSCRSLAFGATPIATSITAPVETDCFRLDGAFGDMARLLLTGTLQRHVVVVRPDGTKRCEAASMPVLGFSCAFDVDGTHTILVEDDLGTRAGVYTIASQRVNRCASATGLLRGGFEQRGSISTVGEIDCWVFGASPGERMEVRLTRDGGALDPVAELMRPDGTTLCGPHVADEFTCEIDAQGIQKLLVGGTAAGRTGSYEISLRAE